MTDTPKNMVESAKTHIINILIMAPLAPEQMLPTYHFSELLKILRLTKRASYLAAPRGGYKRGKWLVEVGSLAIATKTYSSSAASPAKGYMEV
jgi:hypothetical protein